MHEALFYLRVLTSTVVVERARSLLTTKKEGPAIDYLVPRTCTDGSKMDFWVAVH